MFLSYLSEVEALLALAAMGVAVASVRLHPVGGAIALLAIATRNLRVAIVVVRTDVAPFTYRACARFLSYLILSYAQAPSQTYKAVVINLKGQSREIFFRPLFIFIKLLLLVLL